MEWDAKTEKRLTPRVIPRGFSYQRGKKVYHAGGWFRRAILLCVIGFFLMIPYWTYSPATKNFEGEGIPSSLAPRPADWLTPAPSITIGGDAGWTTCPWVNGSGTWGDPYVLRNLTINAGGSGSCITISNTVKVFRVVNCTLTGSFGVWTGGIYLDAVGNGTLLNNTCCNNYNGILCFSSCTNNTFINNNCSWNTEYGFYLRSSSNNNTLAGNNCTENYFGIYFDSSSNNTLTDNTCTGRSLGIRLISSSNNTLADNTCTGNTGGIQLESASNNNTLVGNNCSGNSVTGISHLESFNNTLTGNTCSNNTSNGIQIATYSSNITVIGNNCTRNGQYGIAVTTNYTVISYNNCSRNGMGMQLQGYYNDVFNNWVLKNKDWAITNDCPTCNVHNNFITYMPVAGITSPISSVYLGVSVGLSAVANQNPLVTYVWDFGDGHVEENGRVVTHLYSSTGTYMVTLTVSDPEGDFAATTAQVIITTAPPSGGIDGPSGIAIFLCLGLGALVVILRRFQARSES